jgi:hypothetical protein
VLSAHNHVEWHGPGWKIPAEPLAAARALVEHTEPEEQVLASLEVSSWMTALHGHPTPLVARSLYLQNLEGYLPQQEIERRMQLAWLASGEPPDEESWELLARTIVEDPLVAVCLSSRLDEERARRLMQEAGLSLVHASPAYRVWARR